MNILVTTDRNYLQHAYVMLVSLLENNRNSPINLFYIHYDIDDESVIKFRDYFSKTNLTTIFLKAEKEELRGLYTYGSITSAAYLRICCPDLLPRTVKRILYLDPDVIVKNSLNELYGIDLGECYTAAVANEDLKIYRNPVLDIPKDYGYFNSGVMLIDVERFRRGRISEKALDFSRKMGTDLVYYDQDALNAVLYDKWISLHPRWNVHTETIENYWGNSTHNNREIREALADPAIIHFTSIPKPWDYLCISPFQKDYWHYLKKTPYKGFKLIGFSYPNMIRRFLQKVMIYHIPRKFRDSVPPIIRNRIKDLLTRR